MSVSDEFDEWAAAGKDRGMEERHWHTAKHVLARMPVEAGDTVLDLGCGSGYAGRALKDTKNAGRAYGIDASPAMAANARSYTADPDVGYLVGDFEHLPFETDSVDHCFSMEAFYYATDSHAVLDEVARILRPGGTFHCAVNFYAENVHSHVWAERLDVPMTLWSGAQYREAFREAGLAVAVQDNVPDEETEIPPADAFPTEEWETREAMVERYREFGTLVTVGVA